MLRAYTFILIHNHPSGKATPSPQDNEVMAALAEQAKTLNLSFLDFIIVGDTSYWSMFEENDGGEYGLGTIL
jgi:DNA repair protein RadC